MGWLSKKEPDMVHCPKCNSVQITANKKGFGVTKAIGGGLLLGPIGGLFGLVGRKKIYLSCLNCGHNWKPQNR